MANENPERDEEAYGQPLFDDLITRFVLPEAGRQRASGQLAHDEEVYRFQVLFPEGEEPVVRLNRDVGGKVMATATRAIEAGEAITVDDISGISEYTPREEDAGVPHVTAFAHRDGWSLVFEFGRGGHSDRFEFLDRAGDFYEIASQALEQGRLGPFLDNAYSACELLAKTELLSSRPTVELVLNSRAHGGISRAYNAWAKLGNTEARFAKLLGHLAERRPAARYVQRDIQLGEVEAKEMLDTLKSMKAHVEERAAEGTGAGEPDVFYVYATRELRAGEVIGPDDFTINPPPKPE